MVDKYIKVGVFSPPHHSNREDVTLTMQRDFKLVEWLDELGYSEYWIGEHHSGGMQIYSSPELFIAAAAERTQRIRLGAAVISLPYHNPLTVAGRICQLDHQTRGRAMFGFGPGALSSDAHMLGVSVAKSREQLMQGIDTVVRLLDGETITETTDWYTLRDAHVHIQPYTRPRPQLAVASARTPIGAITAGRYNTALLCANAGQVNNAFNIASESAAKHGGTFDRSNLRVVGSFHLADTREEARKAVQYGWDDYVEYLNIMRPPNPNDKNAAASIEQVIGQRGGIVGTVDDAIEALEKLWDDTGGFGTLLLIGAQWMEHEAQKRSYELFMRYVLPKFTGQNRRREQSMQWMKDNAVRFGEIRDQASDEAMKSAPKPVKVAAS